MQIKSMTDNLTFYYLIYKFYDVYFQFSNLLDCGEKHAITKCTTYIIITQKNTWKSHNKLQAIPKHFFLNGLLEWLPNYWRMDPTISCLGSRSTASKSSLLSDWHNSKCTTLNLLWKALAEMAVQTKKQLLVYHYMCQCQHSPQIAVQTKPKNNLQNWYLC